MNMKKNYIHTIENALIGNNIENLIISDRPVVPPDRIHTSSMFAAFRNASQASFNKSEGAKSQPLPIFSMEDETFLGVGVIGVPNEGGRNSEVGEDPSNLGIRGLRPPTSRRNRTKSGRQNPTEKLRQAIEESAPAILPRSLLLQLAEEVMPLLDRCRQAYVNQLGEKHPITLSYEEHISNMHIKLQKLSLGSLEHVNIDMNEMK